MKLTNLALTAVTLGLAVASAATTYDVTLRETVWVGETQLKAGDYKVGVQGDKVTFKSGKTVTEVPATMTTGDQKYAFTSLQTSASKLKEIDLGGTKSKLLFATDAPAAVGTK